VEIAFRLGRIPVRIQPSFFIMTIVLGMGSLQARPVLALEWLGVVLVSVLLHELGHALMGKAFGLEPRIDLHSMGGTTSWSNKGKLGAGRRILISLAGPMVGIVLGLAVRQALILKGLYPTDVTVASPVVHHAIKDFIWVNIIWGIFNLFPMLPLDGGNVTLGILDGISGGRGELPTRIISVLVAVALGFLSVVTRNWWPALLAGMFAFQNGRAIYDRSLLKKDEPFRKALDQAYEALEAHDGARVLALVAPAIAGAHAPATRAEAVHLAAYAHLLNGRVDLADAAMAGLPSGYQPSGEYVALRDKVASAVAG
jgi:Zn-dependent protease